MTKFTESGRMETLSFNEAWEVRDKVKRRLFNYLRNKIRELQKTAVEEDLTFGDYREKFGEIHLSILNEWKDIKKEYENCKDFRGILLTTTLKGFLYETLFFYSCLRKQNFFMDAEIAETKGTKFPKSPPWFEAAPLYDIIPKLYEVKGERKGPQTDADFVITFVSDEGPIAPSLVGVKSSKPCPNDKNKKRWSWQITAARRRGFTFQIAYPGVNNEYPKSLKEWEIRTPCSKCGNLSEDVTKCDECEEDIFPFTIADSYYREKQLWKLFDRSKKGRF